MKIDEILNIVSSKENSAFFYTSQNNSAGKSILFNGKAVKIESYRLSDIAEALHEVEEKVKKGFIGYGFICYESGYAFENTLSELVDDKFIKPLLKFCFFDKKDVSFFSKNDIDFSNAPDILRNLKYDISDFKLSTSQKKYTEDIKKIKREIAEGNTYQVNYTANSQFVFNGNTSHLFLHLLFNQSASYCAFINNEDEMILSASPELFFHQSGSTIITRPMKGTIKRGKCLEEDFKRKVELEESSKNKAENIMIVDLLRNDFGRISKFNKVLAENIFRIEKYESLYQMTSTVKGELQDKSLKSIFENTFPCGSITGAPKISTMKIIRKLENRDRGIYTGAIGITDAESSHFNVAIRTIKININGLGEMGIGSGVIWDSDPLEEYEEAKLKAKFLTSPNSYFEIFESMLLENGTVFLLEKHIERLKDTADYFLFRFEEKKIIDAINKKINSLNGGSKYKLKLILNKWGLINIESSPILVNMSGVKVLLSDKRTDSDNKFQYFKTTNRQLYNGEFQLAKLNNYDEVIFLNEKGEVAEGSFTNIFIKQENGVFTPQISSGILNGVFRKFLLEQNKTYSEKVLTIDDLRSAKEIFLTNSVRKTISVSELKISDQEILIYS
ncbi:MAG: bifunctional anthranilate synthase component I family protein/aminotransferase class IV [Melioribacteraceae bacterium]|nr:bifunctional anthranilate synthase component I family protein/aminotransferase class IV [Melioribacteraceae bacterium]